MASYARYLRRSLWDFLLLAVCASAAVVVVESGFWAGDVLVAMPAALVAGVVGTLVVLYALSYNRASILAALVVVPVLTVACVAVCARFWDGVMFEDVAGNPCLPALILVLTTVAVYVLTRRRGGIVALAFIGALVCGYLQFIYKENHAVAVVVFFLCLLAVAGYRYYQRTQLLSERGTVQFAAPFGLCCACAVAVMAVALGLYGVVSLADPPVMEPKLIRDYIALPEVDMRGVADTASMDDEDNQTDQKNDEEEELSSTEQEPEEEEEQDGVDESAADDALKDSYDSTGTGAGFSPITYDLPDVVWWVLGIILLVVVLAAPWVIKILLRRRWYRKVCDLPEGEQVEQLYRFFLKRFERLKLGRADNVTPLEYAAASGTLLSAFTTPSGTDFSDVTRAFVPVYYGKRDATPGQLACCHDYYQSFYKNCRRHLGVPGYVLRFFRL